MKSHNHNKKYYNPWPTWPWVKDDIIVVIEKLVMSLQQYVMTKVHL